MKYINIYTDNKTADEYLQGKGSIIQQALISCLSDDNMLVKRETLELLLHKLPVHSRLERLKKQKEIVEEI